MHFMKTGEEEFCNIADDKKGNQKQQWVRLMEVVFIMTQKLCD